MADVTEMTTESTSTQAELYDVSDVRPLLPYVREAWRFRDFTIALAAADARSSHADTLLGGAWQLLNPALLVAVYYLIFGVIFDVTRGMENYLGFLVVGVFLFTFTRKSTSSGARSIINNRSLIQSIRFPRVVLPVATVLAELLIFLPSLLVIYTVVVLTGEKISWTWLLLFPLVLVQLVFNVGLALAASRSTVHFRDLDELLPFLLRLWFYMSGVLYPVSRIGDELGGFWQTVFAVNPANVYITIGRDALLDNSASLDSWLLGLAWAFGVFGAAVWFFRRHELEYGRA